MQVIFSQTYLSVCNYLPTYKITKMHSVKEWGMPKDKVSVLGPSFSQAAKFQAEPWNLPFSSEF